MKIGPNSQQGNKTVATSSKRGSPIPIIPKSTIKYVDQLPFNLGSSCQTSLFSLTKEASMEGSASASSAALTIAETRANDHHKTIDMTDMAMSINSPSTPSLTTHQGHKHSLTSLNNSIESQNPNGKPNSFIPSSSQRTNDPCVNTSSPQRTPSVMDRTGTHGEIHNTLQHGGGPTNHTSDRRYSIDGPNNQRVNGQNSRGTGSPYLDSNMATCANAMV
ncbi:hypothetical protein FXO38_07988 [Capsicum annuum]|nr:hypothetical protein FXO38_07988 [Capsicum annuum]KAF3674050.1 hypothetical protein FXO37_06613 [Capsicum annuum]